MMMAALNTVLTIVCISGLIALGVAVYLMLRAINRDLREMEDERKRELKDFEDNEHE